jgi:hypothetical protein
VIYFRGLQTVMQTNEILDYIKTFSIVFGSVSVSIAALRHTAAVRSDTASIFLALRKYFLDIHAGLYQEIPNLAKQADSGKYCDLTQYQQSIVQKYWVNSFNEWYTTNIIYPNDKLCLWGNFYRKAQASSLLNSLLRSGLVEIFRSNFMSFGAFQSAYRQELLLIADDLISDRIGIPVNAQIKEQLISFRTALMTYKSKV